ncbi:MAG: hypothetical protein ACI8TX_003610 [Hyphomicrobiaceae bacterium]|jgi:hypothetical protein
MKKSIHATALSSAFLLAAFTLHATPNTAQAGDFMSLLSNNGAGYDLSDALLGEDSSLDIGGWTQFGYSTRSTGLFNDQEHSVRNQQTWLYVEKVADGSDGFDLGFRIDAVYGGDAQDTQAFGNTDGEWDLRDNFNHGDDGFAIPQLYVEAAHGDLSVKAGHFYTLVGYEVVTAPDNFFMSHAFTMYLSEPFTHTGVVATYSGFENIEFYGGWTAGWDTGFDQFDGGSSFLGGFSVAPLESVTLTYIATAGNLGAIGDGYSHSIVVDTAVTDNLNYVLQSDFVTTNVDVLGVEEDYESYGLNNYLIYSLSDTLGVGARAEWWNANDASYYEVTAGVNYKPLPNLTFRPELRYQWGDGDEAESRMVTADNPAGLPIDEGIIFGIDAIVTF